MEVNSERVEPDLVVDLDGTLIRVDLLHEAALSTASHHPLSVLGWPLWLMQGRAELKSRLAAVSEIDASALPYHEDVIAWLRSQREAGRRLVLATASHRRWAEAVAAHLGLFDEVLATENGRNLKGKAKRDLLVERFGEQGFDYVGDSSADIPVWEACRTAHIVGGKQRLIEILRASGRLGEIFGPEPQDSLHVTLRALRPHHWAKNLLVFVPLLTAHLYGDWVHIGQGVTAFVAFSLLASALYLLNDLLDLAADRRHPRKRMRPLAAGRLSIPRGIVLAALLATGAFFLAAWAGGPGLALVLLTYAVLTTAYSWVLKRLPVVDVLVLAALYTLRIVAGAVAQGVPLSFWLLSFSMFLFFSLALLKRHAELLAARDEGRRGPLHGRGYQPEDLGMVASLGAAAGYLSVLVLALFIQDAGTVSRYGRPEFMWLACPLLLYWISRAWLIGHRGQMHDDPVVFALRDRASWLCVALVAVCFAAARAGA